MLRSKSLATVALLQTALSVVDVLASMPILAAGSQGLAPQPGQEALGGPPFIIGVFFIIMAVAGFFAAFGVWLNQRWGKILTIIIRAVSILFTLGDFLGAPNLAFQLFAVAYLLVSVLVIYLLLRPERNPAMA